jgi:purine-binding chemotaxis protein CheW
MNTDLNRAPDKQDMIAFKVGGQAFGFDAMSVREIRGWTPPTPLPNSPSYVCGVVNLRGQVLPIVDFGLRLGMDVTAQTPRHVIIVAWVGGQLVGLLVDSVYDIVSVEADRIQPVPEVASDEVRTLVSGIIDFEGRLMSLIRLDRVLPERGARAAA